MDQLRRTLLILAALQTVASEEFRMYVTYYSNSKMVCLDANGSEIFNISIGSAGFSSAIDMFDKKAVNPSIVYSTVSGIYRMNMDGTNITELIALSGTAYSITIDPTTRNIYYIGWSTSSGGKHYIGMVSPFGEHVFLMAAQVDSPRSLALHPAKGLLFWADNADSGPFIGIADMAGNYPRTFVSENIRYLWALTMDFRGDMLYWTDTKTIYRCSLTNQSTEVVLSGLRYTRVDILIDGGYLFFSYWYKSKIERVRINNGNSRMTFSNIAGMKPSSMAVYSTDVLQTPRSTQCSARSGLGDCSNVCIPVLDKYYCSCDNATTLQMNGSTCENGRTQCRAGSRFEDCSNVCTSGSDKFFCACDNATTLQMNGRTCENATLCPDSIPNGTISSACYRHKFEECEFKCDPGRFSDIDKITCIIGEWNDSNPCNKECTGNTFGENCSQTCECTAKHTMHPDQSCDRFSGTCLCLATWKGEKCDVDVDECQMNTHSCNVSEHIICKNKPGGFDCVCTDCFPPEEKKNLGLIIGLSVGIPLGIIAVTLIIYTQRLSKLKRTRRIKRADELREVREESQDNYLHLQKSNDNSEYSTISEQYVRVHETSVTGAHSTLTKPVKEAVSGSTNGETSGKQTTDTAVSDSYLNMELEA